MLNLLLQTNNPYNKPEAWVIIVLGLAFMLTGILRVGLTPIKRANVKAFIVGIGSIVLGVVLLGVAFLLMMR